MARITWQNVAAPDVAQSVYALKAGGDMLQSGFSGLGNVAAGLDQRQKDALSNKAIAAALRSGSRSEFDKVMGADGIQGFGVADPGRLNADAMSFFQNRRGNLADLDNTTSLTAYRNDQRSWFNKDKQFQYDERAKAAQLAEDERAAEQWALATVQGMGDTLYSADAARQSVLNSKDYTPEQEARLLSAIGQAPYWKSSSDAVSNASVNPMLAGIAEDIDTLEANQNFESNSNPLLRYYSLGSQKYDNLSAAGLKMANSLRDLNVDEERIGSYAGEINTTINELSREMSLPPEVVAAAVENNLTNRNWLGWGKDTLQIDKTAVRDLLSGVADDDSRQLLASQSANVKRRAREIADYRNDLQKVQDKIALATTRGDSPAQMESLTREAEEISIRLSKAAEAYRGSGEPGSAQSAAEVAPPPPLNWGASPSGVPISPERRIADEDALFNQVVNVPDGVDPRAAQANQNANSFIDSFRRGLDQRAGQAVGGLGQGISSLGDAAASVISSFDQQAGSDLFRSIDAERENFANAQENGFTAAFRDVPKREVERIIEKTFEELARNDPTLRQAGSVENLQIAIETGVNPETGKPLTQEEFIAYMRSVVNLEKGMRDYLSGNGR